MQFNFELHFFQVNHSIKAWIEGLHAASIALSSCNYFNVLDEIGSGGITCGKLCC